MGENHGLFNSAFTLTMVLTGGVLICATLLAADPVSPALCDVEVGPTFNGIALLPAYLTMLLIGAGNGARTYVRQLLREGFQQQDLKRLFLGLVVAGGSVYRRDGKYCIRLYAKDRAIHGLFRDLAYEIYHSDPQTLRIESRSTYMSQLYSKAAVLEVSEFSPELASRRGETPTISYILEGERRVRVEAARVVMSASGWLTCTFSVTEGGTRAYPRLGLGGVLRRELASEYSDLMGSIPLKMRFYEHSRYRDSGYLATTDRTEMGRFLQAGGFLRESTVKKGVFAGMEKNRLLQFFVENQGREFNGREAAVDIVTKGLDESALELDLYLERLKLG